MPEKEQIAINKVIFVKKPSLEESERIIKQQEKNPTGRIICEWRDHKNSHRISGGVPYFMNKKGKKDLAKDMPDAEMVRVEAAKPPHKQPLGYKAIAVFNNPLKDEIRRITEAQIKNPNIEVVYIWGEDKPIRQVIISPHYSDINSLNGLLEENLIGINQIVLREKSS